MWENIRYQKTAIRIVPNGKGEENIIRAWGELGKTRLKVADFLVFEIFHIFPVKIKDQSLTPGWVQPNVKKLSE